MDKEELRNYYKAIRRKIRPARRKKAAVEALHALQSISQQYPFVLSYASFGDELSTWEINAYFEKKRKLILPKIFGNELRFFHITDSQSQLKANRWGIFEPIEEQAEEISCENIPFALIPGLAFDQFGHRLGYGKGFYDKALSRFNLNAVLYALGFHEQLHPKPLPSEKHDIFLNKVFLC